MSCGVTHFWNVMFCLPMPGGIPGTAPMSISILYSYIPSFILPLSWSKGVGEADRRGRAGDDGEEAGISHWGESSQG